MDGPMTITEQMPYVEKYFAQRGFTPGKHDATAFTGLSYVGNPYQSGTDSFGTNSDSAPNVMMRIKIICLAKLDARTRPGAW